MNSMIRICLLGALIMGATPTTVAAQERGRMNRATGALEGGPKNSPFKLVLSQLPGGTNDSSTVHIYSQIPLNRLVFIHKGDTFEANYEISIFFVGPDDKAAGTLIWTEQVTKNSFAAARADKSTHNAHAAIRLPPNKYRVIGHMTDLDSRKRISTREQIEVETYEPNNLILAVPILLSGEARTQTDPSEMLPVPGATVSNTADSFFVLLTIHSPADQIAAAILNYNFISRKDSVLAGERSFELEPGLNYHVLPFATAALIDRKYMLHFHLKSGELSADNTLELTVEWAGFSQHILDIDVAIEQTRYVANRKQLVLMRGAKGESKQEQFLEFWKGLDPTPGTPKNELMDEYYGRVAYSNSHFETYQDGWESDRGMVHIIYGPPDEIIQNPAQGNRRPTAIWHYYNKNWRFVFVDVNMFGDYQLVTPLYPVGGGN